MAAEVCFQHPERAAVERCEVCGQPVCGSCLWYADSGQRLCPAHAAEWREAGRAVHSPERYAPGIPSSEASARRPPTGVPPYQGNSTDVGALVAAVAGVMALAACVGLAWALPFLALALGVVSWLQARQALNARRTRWLAGVAMASGGVYVLVLVTIAVFFIGLIAFGLAASAISRPTTFPTPVPFP